MPAGAQMLANLPEEQLLGGYWECADCEGGEPPAAAAPSNWRRGRRAVVLGSALSAAAVGFGAKALWMVGKIALSVPAAPLALDAFWSREQPSWSYGNLGSLGDNEWSELFKSFYERFDRKEEYSVGSPEYYKRMDVFRQNTFYIHEFNQNATREDANVTLAPNQFMDMTWQEFRRRQLQMGMIDSTWHGRTNTVKRVDGSHLLGAAANVTLPTSFNWIDRGCVTEVKNQKHCGSCWAFSSTGALEGAYCARSGKLISLSEQQLVDCSKPEGTMGCSGGFMDNAFQYVIDNGGLCAEESYPYEGVDTPQCRATECGTPAVKVSGILDLPPHSDVAIRAALTLYGPVAVAVEADRPVFQFYHKGVLNVKCGKHLNHAVLLVGYDTDATTGEHFWLIKNSWGPEWGDAGYVRLSRDHHRLNGECGVLIAPVIPLIE